MNAHQTTKQPNTQLKNERLLRGWSQQELADLLETDGYTVNRWERGRAIPSPHFRKRLCDLFSKNAVELGFMEESEGVSYHAAKQSQSLLKVPREIKPKIVGPPQPVYLSIPYQRNPFFVGRQALLQLLEIVLGKQNIQQSRSCALSGMGGIGKTQMALEYAYRYSHHYTAVFWVIAESIDNIMASYISIAELLGLPECREQDQSKIVSAVINWLETHRNWLLILDNVENSKLVKDFLPKTQQGSLLFTTRLHTVGTLAYIIGVKQLSLTEGVELLLQTDNYVVPSTNHAALAPAEEEAAYTIASALDGMPLALDQAGAYIRNTCCSLTDFLSLFQDYPMELLSEWDPHASYPLSVARMIILSFEQLQQISKAASHLLTACCFLAPDAIPEILFTEFGTHLETSLQPIVCQPLQFNTALKDLLMYSLIRRDARTKTITVHRLVQRVIKGILPEAVSKEWNESVLRMINHAFTLDLDRLDTGAWPWCEALLPHALITVKQAQLWDDTSVENCSLIPKIATYLLQRARYHEAEPLYQQALSLLNERRASASTEVAIVLTGLAQTKQQLGHYEEAKRIYQQTISLLEEQFGSCHLALATPLSGLASLTFEMSEYQEALTLYKRALALREQALEATHPDIATSLSELAEFYINQGRLQEAELLCTRAIHIRKQAYGHNHPKVGESLNTLGLLYFKQGEYQHIEPLYQQALLVGEQTLGADHPDVAAYQNNLAILYLKQERYDEAEQLLQRAIHIREQIFGKEHPYSAFFQHNLARVYLSQGRYTEAEAIARRALHIYEQHLIPGHPVMATPLSIFARIAAEQGRYQRAESLYERVIAIRTKHLHVHHPDLSASLSDLADLYSMQGRYDEAIACYQRALCGYNEVLTSHHPDIVTISRKLEQLCAQKPYV